MLAFHACDCCFDALFHKHRLQAIDKSYEQTAKACPIFFKYASEQCPDGQVKCKREPTDAEGMAMCDEFTLTACGKDPNAIKHFAGSVCPTYAYRLTRTRTRTLHT